MMEKTSKQEQKGMSGRGNEQFRHVEVRRYLNNMPLFRVDRRNPDRFDDLLARLDRADHRRTGH